MSEYERFDRVPETARRDLADWMLVLADNKRVLGLRYGEWATGAPELEADVAISAMAQYELGHARLLRGALSSTGADPRTDARATDPSTWRCLPALDRSAPSWTEVVALNALVDNLLTVNLAAAAAGGLAPLAQRLRKAVAEEHYHSLHAQAWVARLLDGPAAIVARLQATVDRVWPQCIAWFGPDGADNALDGLAEVGILETGAAGLRNRFLDTTADLFTGGVEVAAVRDDSGWNLGAIDWNDWHEASRRHGTPDFDEESFAMITGAHARAMGVED